MNLTGNTLANILAAFAAFVAAVIYTYGTVAMLFRTFWSKPRPVNQSDLKVSVLKPMTGLDPSIEQNLTTFAELKAPPEFEVILCIATASDDALPVARQFVARYPQRFKLVIGANPTVANGKVAQLSVGLARARNELIWVSDSNVETSQVFFEALVSTWISSKKRDSRPTLIHSPVVAVGGTGFAAALERTHLASFLNPTAELGFIVGEHIVVGKSLLFHRDDMKAVGGLEKFGAYLAEDYMLGQAFAKIGVVQRTQLATRNVIGHIDLVTWFKRHIRWALIRKSVKRAEYFTFELCAYTAVPMLLAFAGLISWKLLLVLLLHRALVDAVSYAALTHEVPRVMDLLLSPVKEIAILIAWVAGIFTTQVRWRDRDVRVGRFSLLLTPEMPAGGWEVAKSDSAGRRSGPH